MPIGVNNHSGNFLEMTGISEGLNEANNYDFDPTATYTDPDASPAWEDAWSGGDEGDNNDVSSPSFLDTAIDNFLDSMTNTGVASALQLIWGKIAHSENLFERKALTPTEKEYVRNALADDEEAQNYVLNNAIDPENARWLVNQKLVDKRRQEEVAQWRAGNQDLVDRVLMGVAGGAGYLLDPLNLIPVSKAMTGIKMVDHLGSGLLNMERARQVASYGAHVGASTSAVVVADDYLRDKAGGQDVNYAFDAAIGFITGATLGATGGLFKSFKRGKDAAEQAGKMDNLEEKAYRDAADLDKVSHKEKGAYERVAELHDATWADGAKSKMLSSYVENHKVVATSSSNLKQLLVDSKGIDIPESAQGMHIPNEDFAVIFTDRVKPHQAENVLIKEFGSRAGLEGAMGEKAYKRLLTNITSWSHRKGSVFNELRARDNVDDPKELLKKAIDEDSLHDKAWESIKQDINKNLRKKGFETQLDTKQVKGILREQIATEKRPEGFYDNPDGSVSFGGLHYSEDNIANPQNLSDYVVMEENLMGDTQKDLFNSLGTHFRMPEKVTNLLRKISKGMEQGIYGEGINSVSPTVRSTIARMFQDARGRGLGYVPTLTAEENKHYILGQLIHEYSKYADIRQQWCRENRQMGQASQMAFDKMVTNAYNAKYAYNTSNIIQDVPEAVMKAVEQMKRLRERMIEIGKNTTDDAINHGDRNLIEKDWYTVDDELHRQIDRDQLLKLQKHFADATGHVDDNKVIDFFDKYIREAMTTPKKEVLRKKLERAIFLQNKRIEKYNADLPEGKEPKELLPEKVSDEQLNAYIDANTHSVAEGWALGTKAIDDPKNIEGSKIGDLDFLRARMPIDTTKIVKLPDGTEFSFDNNLRSYDMDGHVLKNMNRFAGDAALKNIFETSKELDDFMAKAKADLQKAVDEKKMNGHDMDMQLKHLKEAICEFRGSRPPDDARMGRWGAVAKILRGLSYVKNGANMGFNQIGEAGGTMAYGGVRQLFHAFPPLGRYVEKVRMGKVSQDTLRDAEDYIFGSTIEREIFSMNWGDRSVRDALTANTLLDRGLTFVADATANLGKVTSAVNMLPKMTDAMVRGMRVQTMMDSIRAAHGLDVGGKIPLVNKRFRDPFTKAKLKAGHVSAEDFERIKENLKKYTVMEGDVVKSFDHRAWEEADKNSFLKWYGLIQNQAERGIVSATKQGNKNLLKNSSQFWQIFFQFKDYNLRAINAQTFRAMTAGDLDDAMATGLSVVMNTVAYAGRVGLTIGALKASGLDEKAKSYADYMFNGDTLKRVVATRSTILGSPLSFANDIYEAAAGAPSIRTTVSRSGGKKKDRNSKDVIGDVVAQLPAVREASNYTFDVYHAFSHATDDKFTKRDFRNVIHMLPIPNMIPFYSYTQYLTEHSNFKGK